MSNLHLTVSSNTNIQACTSVKVKVLWAIQPTSAVVTAYKYFYIHDKLHML